MTAIRLAELAERFGLAYRGSGDTVADHVAPLESAGPGALSFMADARHRKFLAKSQAAIVVVHEDYALETGVPTLLAPNPHLVFARAANIVAPPRREAEGMHPTAWVDPGVTLGSGVAIGAHASIGRGCHIGAQVQIGPGCVIGEDVEIGEGTHLMSRVTVHDRCVIGQRCCIQPGAVVGSTGFGYANDGGHWEPVPQLGRVWIGDDVDVGANTTIDRGAIDDTVIGNGVKLDNQVQVGHNVYIGEHTIIAACTGIAGSTRIGRNCAFGGAVGISGHLRITDGVQLTGMSQVTKSLNEPGIYSSGTGIEPNSQWRRNAVRFHQLDGMSRRLRDLEKQAGNREAPPSHQDRVNPDA